MYGLIATTANTPITIPSRTIPSLPAHLHNFLAVSLLPHCGKDCRRAFIPASMPVHNGYVQRTPRLLPDSGTNDSPGDAGCALQQSDI